ncbi:GTP 3',8-cyclase MoaA [Chryseobacterium wanjuense]
MRLAITDRCNLRCQYCMPEQGLDWLDRKSLLSNDEILRLCTVFSELGVTKVRLTGGEPFIRKDFPTLLGSISDIEGIDDIGITTNGLLTSNYLKEIKNAGIKSVNLSLDTLDESRFFQITRRKGLDKVIKTMHLLLENNIDVKINTVVMENQNIDDIIPLVKLSEKLPVSIRFIEEMPFNGGSHDISIKWNFARILEFIKSYYPEMVKIPDPKNSTSYNYKIPGFLGNIGIIAAYTRSFCGTCNRLRLTPNGLLRTCLYEEGTLNLRDEIRKGRSDKELKDLILLAVSEKTKDGWEAEKNKNQSIFKRVDGNNRRIIMETISVEEAEKIILSQVRHFGTKNLPYENALGKILAEDLFADRDLPPFNRATVDGIAIKFSSYEKGNRSFTIKAVQAAGQIPVDIASDLDCIEIMTGSAVGDSLDTVIRYEDITINGETATINIDIKNGQNIHFQGKDKQKGQILVKKNQIITPAIIGIAASVGKTSLSVKENPKIIIISTGDEMISPELVPNPFQLRRSNGIMIQTVLKKYNITADMLHLNDDFETIKKEILRCNREYDVMIMTGGVSMGKFDYLPEISKEIGYEKLFHKIKQRPGKPFWFGKSPDQKLIFAFPGNPVSVFLCLYRYFVPWLEQSLEIKSMSPKWTVLQHDFSFQPSLQYFTQVKTEINEDGLLTAKIIDTNGSGDFSHLAEANAFMELPLEKSDFKAGEKYRIWFFNPNF